MMCLSYSPIVMAAPAQGGDESGDNVNAVQVEAAVGAGQGGRADLDHETRPVGQTRGPGACRAHAPSSSSE